MVGWYDLILLSLSSLPDLILSHLSLHLSVYLGNLANLKPGDTTEVARWICKQHPKGAKGVATEAKTIASQQQQNFSLACHLVTN